MTHKTVPIEATNEMWQAAFDIYGTQFHEDQMQSHILCIQAMYREMVAHAPPDNTVQDLREQVAELEKSNIALRLQYSGAIGLLCTVSTNLRENGMKDDILDAIEQAASDFCSVTDGWKAKRVIDLISVEPIQHKEKK